MRPYSTGCPPTVNRGRGSLVGGVVRDQLIDSVSAEETDVDGQPGVLVVVKAHMPPLGLWGPGIDFSVEGHAVKETGE